MNCNPREFITSRSFFEDFAPRGQISSDWVLEDLMSSDWGPGGLFLFLEKQKLRNFPPRESIIFSKIFISAHILLE